MSCNRLVQIHNLGQSIWYDNIERKLIRSGAFQNMIEQDHLCGVTSNPTIFDKAISQSEDYDSSIAELIQKGFASDDIYWNLVIKDIQDTADIFLPVYKSSNQQDGYVSIEVSPLLAKDTDGSIRQAKELHDKVARDNVMIKIPATKEGLPVIKELISEGINVNVTLIFSCERYQEVMEAYVQGLESQLEKKGAIRDSVSVASFFVSRVDSSVDKLLDAKLQVINGNQVKRDQILSLKGKIAIANSKIAYQAFKEFFASPRFKQLEAKGARVQRPLWASTSTKNPEYRDVMYVEALIGENTVNTLPPATLDAFRDHGDAQVRIEDSLDQAKSELKSLNDLGIDLNQVTSELEDKGVQLFSQSFNQLLTHLQEKQEKLSV